MGTKLLKLTSLLLLAATLTGCPGEEECFAPAAITQVDDLILISPFQQIYNQGDVITFSVTIPATNNYFNDGTEINLLEATNAFEARLICTDQIFIGNNVEFVKGSPGSVNGWFNLIYNNENQLYELEIKVTLNKIGTYTIYTADSIAFQGEKICNRYTIETNIIDNEPGRSDFIFTVQ
ncbi:hypothetical protein [Flavobacterium sp.]|jgi:hypothetical protein|uniref:hypothetical protein n=1 Tax=Flavobacterium sp. TaxID=239 RepID=UPI0037C00F64